MVLSENADTDTDTILTIFLFQHFQEAPSTTLRLLVGSRITRSSTRPTNFDSLSFIASQLVEFGKIVSLPIWFLISVLRSKELRNHSNALDLPA